jgi:DNA-binding NarL/FixJ family response regulator
MDRSTRILVIARPGHSRQSLVALLKTLPHAELFLSEAGHAASIQPPHLVLIDLGGLHPLGLEALKRAAQEWPAARLLALVEDIRQISPACALGADCALPHNASAGELLQAVQQLSQESPALYRATARFPVPAII